MIRNRRNIGSFWRGIDKNFSLKLEGERGVKPIQFFAGRRERRRGTTKRAIGFTWKRQKANTVSFRHRTQERRINCCGLIGSSKQFKEVVEFKNVKMEFF